MIVLDENLLVLRLGNPIAAWYPGRVCSIVDLEGSRDLNSCVDSSPRKNHTARRKDYG